MVCKYVFDLPEVFEIGLLFTFSFVKNSGGGIV